METLRDEAVPPAAQRAMRRAVGCKVVVAIDSDHSPQLSRPWELADVLERLAGLVPGATSAVRTAEV
ncbi:hypothetical protein QRX50_25400 [Amycolatopsis carbonis]|uniref:Alpha/beta hydrolase n=1 Tax=Amycolatopsis carbonis TaxID=715471 RepID=A0A9Y2I9A8_9PSEU|nr:hypothetical protein [Amycolatopsis sp. 2-15]WIX74910.1 hypothetical protein QRX50_25400 [Amycolatopsis sp. 2-15]